MCFGLSIFPASEAILGGQEWTRRISFEFQTIQESVGYSRGIELPNRVGAASFGFGAKSRFNWGPFFSLEAWARQVPRFSERDAVAVRLASRNYGFSVPVRVAWAEGQFLAPVLGYILRNYGRTGQLDGTDREWPVRWNSIPIGMQLRMELLGLGIWTEATFSLNESVEIENQSAARDFRAGQWSVQVDWSYELSSYVYTIIGLKREHVYHRWLVGDDERLMDFASWDLVLAIRF